MLWWLFGDIWKSPAVAAGRPLQRTATSWPCPCHSGNDSDGFRVTLSQVSLQSDFCNIFQLLNMPQIALTAYPPLPMLRALPPILRLAGVAACCSGDTLRIGDNDRTEPR